MRGFLVHERSAEGFRDLGGGFCVAGDVQRPAMNVIALPWHHQRVEGILQHLLARQLPAVEALLRCISGQLRLQLLQSEATLFDLISLDVSSGWPILLTSKCPVWLGGFAINAR